MKDEEVPLWATTRDVAAASARRVERTTGDIWGSGVGGGRKERMGRRKETRDKVEPCEKRRKRRERRARRIIL